MKQTGKVWLVGAGPGDVGLFTLKGKQVLEQAQLVMYDALVSMSVLALIPKDAEKIFVGGGVGVPALTQEQINELLVEYACAGMRVVRLKGGDPFLVDRGSEELLALQAHGISYEVVPGISSALAVPAYNGIPVTHRMLADSVHIITGYQQEKKPCKLPYDAYTDLGGTLVFLMGLSALEELVNGLLRAGMPAYTPAAVLEKGTMVSQRRVCATLETIVQETARAELQPPAIIVIGAAVSLSESLAWYEKLPLSGRAFVLTSSAERMLLLAEELRMRGAKVMELPALETQPRAFEKEQPYIIEETAKKRYACLVFTAPAGVTSFFEAFFTRGYDARALAGVKLAAMGSGTERALRTYGLRADIMPQPSSGETLGRRLGECLPSGSRVALFRSSAGNSKLVAQLEAAAQDYGKRFVFADISAYDTVLATDDLTSALPDAAWEKIAGIFFTSASTVCAFLQQHPQLEPAKLTALCIGARTAQAAREANMRTIAAKEASVAGLLELAEHAASLS